MPLGELAGNERGRLVHGLLESHVPGSSEGASEHTVEEAGARARPAAGARERAHIAGMLQALAGAPLTDRLARARSVRAEHPFALALGGEGRVLTGVIDLLADEGDGTWLIVDYKTDRVGEHDDLGALVESVYGLQRELYALAGLRGGARTVEVAYWFLERPGAWVGRRYSALNRDELEARLENRVQRILESAFTVSPRPHRGLCRGCPGLRGLCSWSAEETGRMDPGANAED